MNLTINGERAVITNKGLLSISKLLDELNVADPLYVTVAVNGDILARSDFESMLVKNGDEVEFLYFMGGGM